MALHKPTPTKAPKKEADDADPFRKSGYGSRYTTPEEMAAMREKVSQEARKGPTRGVLSGHDLSGIILAASVLESGDLSVSVNITGTLSRPEGQWESKGQTISVVVPAKKITAD